MSDFYILTEEELDIFHAEHGIEFISHERGEHEFVFVPNPGTDRGHAFVPSDVERPDTIFDAFEGHINGSRSAIENSDFLFE